MVEHQVLILNVGGSNPSFPANSKCGVMATREAWDFQSQFDSDICYQNGNVAPLHVDESAGSAVSTKNFILTFL